jgi:hypothetical protein
MVRDEKLWNDTHNFVVSVCPNISYEEHFRVVEKIYKKMKFVLKLKEVEKPKRKKRKKEK